MSRGFTIVTPNFNMGRYLAATIESVLSNLGPDDEYFIIDGGSGDESVEVIHAYARYLSGWVSEPDRGHADALRKGFARANGQFLAWLNSGDILLADSLQQARDVLIQSRADMIFGDDFYIDEQGRVIGLSRAEVASLRNYMLYGGWTPLQDACFWRRTLYERVGGIDPTLKYASDYDLFLRFSMTGVCRYVSQVFSAFRRHEGQKSIEGSAAYLWEKEASRTRALQTLSRSRQSILAMKIFYWIMVRYRTFFSHRLEQDGSCVGVSASALSCRQYQRKG